MSGWWARSEGGGERGGGGSRVYRMIILTDMNAASDGGRGEGGWHPQARLCAGDKDAGERGTLESVGGGVLASRSGVAQTAGIARES